MATVIIAGAVGGGVLFITCIFCIFYYMVYRYNNKSTGNYDGQDFYVPPDNLPVVAPHTGKELSGASQDIVLSPRNAVDEQII